ncbi:MAG: aminotransferase class IV [Thermoguttaceae bacterium]|jgi:branched-subunit amino acid aminotransferase/4-amino-4-deoxychorismate lyase
MNEPQAYLNGNWIPASSAAVSATDAGFVLGVTVAEQLRTFSGRIFRLEDHLARLERSLQVVGLDPGLNRRQWTAIAYELAERNKGFLAPGDDWGLSMFVTPGAYHTYGPAEHGQPTVCMHSYPLPFHLWAEKYRAGQALVTTPIEQVARQCWPPDVKCRSRMHYYLADKLAIKQEPGARAVLLDREGYVTEASTANVLIYRKGRGLISPPFEKILPGISLAVTFEIAGSLGIACEECDLRVGDLAAADEIILTSTPMCMLPVTRFNGRPIGGGLPGEISQKLLAAWSKTAGLDIVGQAEQFARRRL